MAKNSTETADGVFCLTCGLEEESWTCGRWLEKTVTTRVVTQLSNE